MDIVRRKMLERKRNTVREKEWEWKELEKEERPWWAHCCLDTAEEGISEFADRLIKTLETEMQRGKRKIWNRISGNCDSYNTWHVCIMVVPEGVQEKGTEEIFE